MLRLRLVPLIATIGGMSINFAQVPAGNIAGTVIDPSAAAITGAKITIINKQTGTRRAVISGPEGRYAADLLPAGEYEIQVEARDFQPQVDNATVLTGSTTTANLRLRVGSAPATVMVEGAAPQIQYDSYQIGGVVTRREIEGLPLNGRSFLQLAVLEPGVTGGTGSLAKYNAQFTVSVLGGDDRRTAISVDGADVRNPLEGQTSQNFSQEIVQEFQISTVNFDLSTGNSAFGAVNIITRSGGNDFHGSGYFFSGTTICRLIRDSGAIHWLPTRSSRGGSRVSGSVALSGRTGCSSSSTWRTTISIRCTRSSRVPLRCAVSRWWRPVLITSGNIARGSTTS